MTTNSGNPNQARGGNPANTGQFSSDGSRRGETSVEPVESKRSIDEIAEYAPHSFAIADNSVFAYNATCDDPAHEQRFMALVDAMDRHGKPDGAEQAVLATSRKHDRDEAGSQCLDVAERDAYDEFVNNVPGNIRGSVMRQTSDFMHVYRGEVDWSAHNANLGTEREGLLHEPTFAQPNQRSAGVGTNYVERAVLSDGNDGGYDARVTTYVTQSTGPYGGNMSRVDADQARAEGYNVTYRLDQYIELYHYNQVTSDGTVDEDTMTRASAILDTTYLPDDSIGQYATLEEAERAAESASRRTNWSGVESYINEMGA